MRPDIDPAIMAAVLGRRQFARRRWRPWWWRISFLAFTVGFWCLAGWAVSAFFGARS